jgi:hypothetical protein
MTKPAVRLSAHTARRVFKSRAARFPRLARELGRHRTEPAWVRELFASLWEAVLGCGTRTSAGAFEVQDCYELAMQRARNEMAVLTEPSELVDQTCQELVQLLQREIGVHIPAMLDERTCPVYSYAFVEHDYSVLIAFWE